MTSKPTLPKDLLKEIDPNNKVWFEKYESESDPRKSYYHPAVQEFLEFCADNSDKEIKDIDRADVDSYITALKRFTSSPSTINGRLSALSSFRDFLRSNYSEVFGEKFLRDLPPHERKSEENPTNIRALSVKQLSYARKYNRRFVKDEYIFELFFQLRIDKNKLIARIFPEDRTPQIEELIQKLSTGKVSNGTIESYFTRLTNHLKKQDVYEKNRRNINSYDLHESHDAYFFRCPNCKKTFENTANHWVLAKVKFDNSDYQDEYRIVCVQCKGGADES